MPKKLIKWDQTGERFYETGVDQGVLYVKDAEGNYPEGVAWNGLISVSENPTGAEPTPFYADNIKYLNLMSIEEFGASIEAFTYPEEFEQCDGSAALAKGVTVGQQKRSEFGLSYRTKVGNDLDDELGYKLHLVYGALASPTDKEYQTINESPEAITFSWEVVTTPVPVSTPGLRPTASVVIDSTKVDKAKLQALEAILYGQAADEEGGTETKPRLPMPEEIASMFAEG